MVLLACETTLCTHMLFCIAFQLVTNYKGDYHTRSFLEISIGVGSLFFIRVSFEITEVTMRTSKRDIFGVALGYYGVFHGVLGVEWWLERAVVVILGVHLDSLRSQWVLK